MGVLVNRASQGTYLNTVCSGADSGVSVIVTEEVIARYAEHLHQLRMIDYTAEQGPGISEEYQVRWSGKDVGKLRH